MIPKVAGPLPRVARRRAPATLAVSLLVDSFIALIMQPASTVKDPQSKHLRRESEDDLELQFERVP